MGGRASGRQKTKKHPAELKRSTYLKHCSKYKYIKIGAIWGAKAKIDLEWPYQSIVCMVDTKRLTIACCVGYPRAPRTIVDNHCFSKNVSISRHQSVTAGLPISDTHTKNQFANGPEGLRHFRDHRWKALGEENPDLSGPFLFRHYLC